MTDVDDRIRVKLVTRGGRRGNPCAWAKQCPGGQPRWDRCEFIGDPFCRDYDWLVIVDDVPRSLPGKCEPLACPPTNTILVTSEPSSVTRYGHTFAAQFGTVLTNQAPWALPHPNAIRSQTGNIWYYGKDFDTIVQSPPPVKSLPISTVCSSKRQAYTNHARRYDFTQRLKAELPELEIFGHGVRYIEKKSEALDPYKFHLVIENQLAPHLWSEKLADAFLACSVPIYCGCPNVLDYFPEESVIRIDIDDFAGSLQTIRALLARDGEYERRLEAVMEARRRVLYEYNLPAMLNRIVTAPKPAPGRASGVIRSRAGILARHPIDLMRFVAWRGQNLFRTIAARICTPLKPS